MTAAQKRSLLLPAKDGVDSEDEDSKEHEEKPSPRTPGPELRSSPFYQELSKAVVRGPAFQITGSRFLGNRFTLRGIKERFSIVGNKTMLTIAKVDEPHEKRSPKNRQDTGLDWNEKSSPRAARAAQNSNEKLGPQQPAPQPFQPVLKSRESAINHMIFYLNQAQPKEKLSPSPKVVDLSKIKPSLISSEECLSFGPNHARRAQELPFGKNQLTKMRASQLHYVVPGADSRPLSIADGLEESSLNPYLNIESGVGASIDILELKNLNKGQVVDILEATKEENEMLTARILHLYKRMDALETIIDSNYQQSSSDCDHPKEASQSISEGLLSKLRSLQSLASRLVDQLAEIHEHFAQQEEPRKTQRDLASDRSALSPDPEQVLVEGPQKTSRLNKYKSYFEQCFPLLGAILRKVAEVPLDQEALEHSEGHSLVNFEPLSIEKQEDFFNFNPQTGEADSTAPINSSEFAAGGLTKSRSSTPKKSSTQPHEESSFKIPEKMPKPMKANSFRTKRLRFSSKDHTSLTNNQEDILDSTNLAISAATTTRNGSNTTPKTNFPRLTLKQHQDLLAKNRPIDAKEAGYRVAAGSPKQSLLRPSKKEQPKKNGSTSKPPPSSREGSKTHQEIVQVLIKPRQPQKNGSELSHNSELLQVHESSVLGVSPGRRTTKPKIINPVRKLMYSSEQTGSPYIQ